MAGEQERDLTWRPTEEEFVSPLTAQQWAELLEDSSFVESDEGRGVLCLRDYGEPATFQQLSIQYRGTMGRFRRWLSDAAQRAGERFGVAAPRQDQYGLDEWWPLLYQTRPAGKPGANMFEMRLRPEVLEGFDLVNEKERQAKKAENVRNLKRIEKIERARQQERERQASAAASQAEQAAAPEANGEEEPQQQQSAATEAVQETQATVPAAVSQETQADVPATPQEAPQAEPTPPRETEQLRSSLRLGELRELLSSAHDAAAPAVQALLPLDVAAPVDYALRYAERLRSVFALMQEGEPQLTAAAVARTLGDESVEPLQAILNGEKIPDFAYLDVLQDHLFVNAAYLEAREGEEAGLSAFCALVETMEPDAVADIVEKGAFERLYLVYEVSGKRRCTAVVCLGHLRYALLARTAIPASALEGVQLASSQVSSSVLDALLAGKMWPGSVV